jgi:tRNA-Thr(GGU) m(6)t(6)A37 methyltransferase TsaA
LTPRIVVGDVDSLVDFLRRAFGASGEVVGDRPAIVRLGDSVLMISGVGPRPATPAFLYLYVDDADATHARAVAAGARSVEPPVDTPYGDRRAMVEDRWGNVWQIATAAPGRRSAADNLTAVGYVRSPLTDAAQAPRQGGEGAPEAWIDLHPSVAPAMHGLGVGDEIIIITWLHQADRGVLQVHPRGETSLPLTGVFATRSPHRPNPLGLHQVTVRSIEGTTLKVGPLEAIDGTPVVDIKPVI